jgi:hypothetical protein
MKFNASLISASLNSAFIYITYLLIDKGDFYHAFIFVCEYGVFQQSLISLEEHGCASIRLLHTY